MYACFGPLCMHYTHRITHGSPLPSLSPVFFSSDRSHCIHFPSIPSPPLLLFDDQIMPAFSFLPIMHRTHQERGPRNGQASHLQQPHQQDTDGQLKREQESRGKQPVAYPQPLDNHTRPSLIKHRKRAIERERRMRRVMGTALKM